MSYKVSSCGDSVQPRWRHRFPCVGPSALKYSSKISLDEEIADKCVSSSEVGDNEGTALQACYLVSMLVVK